ncbi:hypothetical protein [Brevibacterium luteolum]|uniref:Uncharacterized protein n=1 Tax=Brevibacterium luteolum TaxID=199591 RepID=A0A6G8KYB3_9MICO|nr:hypothetical protein [Brevibacterium luteolum]QIN29804.1 hypothetical protein EW640_11355 [Brevibacterium luteolum]
MTEHEEVGTVTSKIMTKKAIKRFAVQSTRESAKLESRVVPATHVRSERVKRFVAQRHQRS